MNLKEAFRYQNFLDTLMTDASYSIQNREHCLITTKKHLRSKANPEAVDTEEIVDAGDFYSNDIVLGFMQYLIGEREKLSTAIGEAKMSLGFDLDAAVATNKFRQRLSNSVRSILRYTAPKKRIEQGQDYRFNIEGNQTPYIYDVEVTVEAAYDTASAKEVMRSVNEKADKVSAMIDAAMINTTVNYNPTFDVNDDFNDVMERFQDAIN